MNRFTRWIDKNWLDIMAFLMFTVVMVAVTFWNAEAHAGLVGQSEPDENGTVLCYYTDFSTGESYIKHAKHVCPSS